MRALLLTLWLVAASGCAGGEDDFGPDAPGAGDSGDASDGDGASGSPGGAPLAQDCRVEDDCIPAGASCCECPSFALPADSGWDRSCEEIECPTAPADAGCSATAVACTAGACVLRCASIPCELSCAAGFARDPGGCLVCTCAPPEDPSAIECASDGECVQVPADCCGCEAGGEDTAVPASRVDAHHEGLDCRSMPICPGVNVCDVERGPRCLGGSCALAPMGDAGAGGESPEDLQLCGRSELSPCRPGTMCVLNAPGAGDATHLGLGVCAAP